MMCSPLALLFISSAYFGDEILVYDHELNKNKIYPRQAVGRGNETQLSVGEISITHIQIQSGIVFVLLQLMNE